MAHDTVWEVRLCAKQTHHVVCVTPRGTHDMSHVPHTPMLRVAYGWQDSNKQVGIMTGVLVLGPDAPKDVVILLRHRRQLGILDHLRRHIYNDRPICPAINSQVLRVHEVGVVSQATCYPKCRKYLARAWMVMKPFLAKWRCQERNASDGATSPKRTRTHVPNLKTKLPNFKTYVPKHMAGFPSFLLAVAAPFPACDQSNQQKPYICTRRTYIERDPSNGPAGSSYDLYVVAHHVAGRAESGAPHSVHGSVDLFARHSAHGDKEPWCSKPSLLAMYSKSPRKMKRHAFQPPASSPPPPGIAWNCRARSISTQISTRCMARAGNTCILHWWHACI